jgi:hypothetical protein
MRASWIALTVVLLIGILPSTTQAQVTGTVDTSVGWLSLPLSDLNALLQQHNYPGISEHFLSFGVRTSFSVKDIALRLGLGGQAAFALPTLDHSDQADVEFVFLYGGVLAELAQSSPTLGQISLGSLIGIGGAFLDIERFRREPANFDEALSELVQATGQFARGYWVVQPYLSLSLPIPLEQLKIKWSKGALRSKPINPELTVTVGYLYAFPWSGWGLIDSNGNSGGSWLGPLDRPSGPIVTVAFRMDIASLERPHVVIDSIRYRGDDEVVTLVNRGRREVDLSGWQVVSSTAEDDERIAQVFVFPQGCVVPAGGRVRVHSGPAVLGRTNTPCGQAEIDLYDRYAGVDSEGAEVWDDRADAARLLDAYGERVDRCVYKSKPELDATECPSKPK